MLEALTFLLKPSAMDFNSIFKLMEMSPDVEFLTQSFLNPSSSKTSLLT